MKSNSFSVENPFCICLVYSFENHFSFSFYHLHVFIFFMYCLLPQMTVHIYFVFSCVSFPSLTSSLSSSLFSACLHL